MNPRSSSQSAPNSTHRNATATAKAAAVAGSAAALAAGQSQAAIVPANGLPLSISYVAPGPFNWDVDNNGQTDFLLRTSGGIRQFIGSGSLNGRGWVNFETSTERLIQNLPSSFNVGPTLPTGATWGDAFGSRALIFSFQLASGVEGFTNGVDGYAGFRFTDAGGVNLYYGWARINIDVNEPDPGFSILEAYYNNEAGGSIHIPDAAATVPEPSTYGAGLLALGAVGLAAYRRRRAAASAA